MDDVLSYLQAKGLQIKTVSGGREVHVPCFMCNEPDGKRGRLYINVDSAAEIPGLFQCKLCDAHGSLVSIKKHFGDATDVQVREDNSYQRRMILETAATYYFETLSEYPEHVKWLREKRGLSIGTIRNARLGYADGGLFTHLRKKGFEIRDIQDTGLVVEDRSTHRLVDFLRGHLTIPYTSAGNVVMVRGRDLGAAEAKYVTPPGQKGRLYNSEAAWDAEEIIVCEGELDALSASQMGFCAVGLPGASSFQPTWVDYFAEAKRVFVLTDPDEAGDKGAEKVAGFIGPKTRRVRLPDGLDVNSWAVAHSFDGAAFKALLKESSKGLLVTVDEAYAEHRDLQGQPGLQFGLGELDKFIRPGLIANQVMVMLAKTGTGKTIVKMNIMHRIAQQQPDAKMLLLSLELTRGDWWERARRIYRFYNHFATDEEILEFWRQRLLLVDRNRLTEAELLQVVSDYCDEMGQPPDLMVLDYLGYFARSFRGDPYQRVSDAVMALKGVAKEYLIPVLTSHQVSRMTEFGGRPDVDAARDSGVIEETADFVFPVWAPDMQKGRDEDEMTGELNLLIGKSRHGGTGHVEKLRFAPLSLSVCSIHERQYVGWAADEREYRKRGETWEYAIERHAAGLPAAITDPKKIRAALLQKRQDQLSLQEEAVA